MYRPTSRWYRFALCIVPHQITKRNVLTTAKRNPTSDQGRGGPANLVIKFNNIRWQKAIGSAPGLYQLTDLQLKKSKARSATIPVSRELNVSRLGLPHAMAQLPIINQSMHRSKFSIEAVLYDSILTSRPSMVSFISKHDDVPSTILCWICPSQYCLGAWMNKSACFFFFFFFFFFLLHLSSFPVLIVWFSC